MSNIFGTYGRAVVGMSQSVGWNASTGAVLLVTLARLPELPILFGLMARTADARVLQGTILASRSPGDGTAIRTLIPRDWLYPLYIDQADGLQNQFQLIGDSSATGTLEVQCLSALGDFGMTSV